MSWILTAVERLAGASQFGYRAGADGATEPTALAALALLAHDRADAASRPLHWLLAQQNRDGSVGIGAGQATPCWPTGMAVLAWRAAQQASPDGTEYRAASERAVAWLLEVKGSVLPRTPQLGHDTTLIGWPWVEGTHSWLEPTAWAVLALKAAGKGHNARTEEGTRLIIDRLLPTGGCNYGNTFVLGQKLRPQLEPTGLALLALGPRRDFSGRVDAACNYLLRNISAQTPSVSLSYAVLGLAARDQLPIGYDAWLAAAYQRTAKQGGDALATSLLLLAALGPQSPPLTLAHASQEVRS
jgi:hypothetical protein